MRKNIQLATLLPLTALKFLSALGIFRDGKNHFFVQNSIEIIVQKLKYIHA